MTINLIRIDASDCNKTQLRVGKHIMGRGKLIDSKDKRISREHGELLVEDDSITIRALHQNPCFFTLKGSTLIEILQIGTCKTLYNGDRFGLLPDDFWFEIIYCPTDVESSGNNETEKTTGIVDEHLLESDHSNSNELNSNPLTDDESIVTNINDDETFNNGSRPEPPSLISTNNDETIQINQNKPVSNSDEPVQPEINEPESSNLLRQCNQQKSENDDGSSKTSPIKRSHSPDSQDVKKIKTENITVKIDPDDVKPGPSDLRGAANGNDGASKDKPNRPRERCIYGTSCYRRNPQHLSQFSHPRDADWGAGERGACPYGAACARRDPRHWRAHDHPPGVLPPPTPGHKKRQKKNDQDEDVSPAQNIVTGKRIHRAVQYKLWSGSGSETEPDPYGTDESDEWEPDSRDYSEDI